jgi:hypothetical protein
MHVEIPIGEPERSSQAMEAAGKIAAKLGRSVVLVMNGDHYDVLPRDQGALTLADVDYGIRPQCQPYDVAEMVCHRADRDARRVTFSFRGAIVDVWPGEDDEAVHKRLMIALEAKGACMSDDYQPEQPKEPARTERIGSEGTANVKHLFEQLQRYLRDEIDMIELPAALGEVGVALALLFKHEVVGTEKPKVPVLPALNLDDVIARFEERADGRLWLAYNDFHKCYAATWVPRSKESCKPLERMGQTIPEAIRKLAEAIDAEIPF